MGRKNDRLSCTDEIPIVADDLRIRSRDIPHSIAIVWIAEDNGRFDERSFVRGQHRGSVVDELTTLTFEWRQ
jgi:hypothetical protein